jgi:hypothetical protein
MGNLDDGVEQNPLDQGVVQKEILSLLPQRNFDLIITHDPNGEYTRHRRHEETGIGVINLLQAENIKARHLWTFAYEDGGRKYLPKVKVDADFSYKLSKDIWLKKYEIITGVYGFAKTSFEARATPRKEAFRCFNNPPKVEILLNQK